MYTFKILLESTDNNGNQHRFKEAVYQTNLMLGFSTKKNLRQYILKEINKQLKADQDLSWQAVGIIAISESEATAELPQYFTQVSSRPLPVPAGAVKKDVYQAYYPDPVWEEDER